MVRGACPAVGKFYPRFRTVVLFPYTGPRHVPTEFVESCPQSPKKSEFYQETPNCLPIFLPVGILVRLVYSHSSASSRNSLIICSPRISGGGTRSFFTSRYVDAIPRGLAPWWARLPPGAHRSVAICVERMIDEFSMSRPLHRTVVSFPTLQGGRYGAGIKERRYQATYNRLVFLQAVGSIEGLNGPYWARARTPR